MYKKLVYFSAVILGAYSCQVKKDVQETPEVANAQTITLPAPDSASLVPQRPPYQPAKRKVNNVLHTKLDLKFDWDLTHVLGTAYLDISPQFYPTDSLTLDAKGFDIHKVELVGKEQNAVLDHVYNSKKLRIRLDREYKASETYRVYIEYTAKPNELEEGGSKAITSDKGLYFINPDGANPTLPKQIWTQGETEASSCWFPTIDASNQRMTQEIYLTVQEKFQTLSNGILVFSIENGDGTRTDYWKQSLGHAPYLAMLAVGEFAVVKDSWERKDGTSIDVHYFVDQDYKDHAQAIFGNTPEMLSFYSDILGVEYPWEKYHQVVVKEFVSGAMENTTAVVHGDFLHQTTRELMDGDNEGVIAHELFHHWFGDLLTCESWANLPLNESFATYGEYLWLEHKYGREYADRESESSMGGYFRQSKRVAHNMIWFDHEHRDDMFDAHSYNKGGRILHMLRKYLGDEAFFLGLKTYIEKHKYSSVEIHDLRIVFEKLTGQDLNWFFNQWFFEEGHPVLKISQRTNGSKDTLVVQIEQVQNFKKSPVYRLPLRIDMYTKDSIVKQNVVMNEFKQDFTFAVKGELKLVIVDGERMLLAEREEEKPTEQYIYQYYNAPLYRDKIEAIRECAKVADTDSLAGATVVEAMNDDFWQVRSEAVRLFGEEFKFQKTFAKPRIIALAKRDKRSIVRRRAISSLSDLYERTPEIELIYEQAILDSSYSVIAQGLDAIVEYNPKRAMEIAKEKETENATALRSTIAGLYGEQGGEDEYDFFEKVIKETSGFGKFRLIRAFNTYTTNQGEDIINKSLPLYKEIVLSSKSSWVKITAIQGLLALDELYMERKVEAENSLSEAEQNQERAELIAEIQKDLNLAKAQRTKISTMLEELKRTEDNPTVQRFLSGTDSK